jgi:hypothetical protein
MSTPFDRSRVLDVAVVGAGIAGVYSARRRRGAEPDELTGDLRSAARENGGRLRVGWFEPARPNVRAATYCGPRSMKLSIAT